MIRHDITPTAQLGRRAPEAGRIRMGVKTAKAMKSIDTFRFTSPDRQSIEQIATRYGGTPEVWNEPKANPSSQWQVITTSNEIRVLLVPDGLSTWYELWAGSGCIRRCDGIEVEVPQVTGNDYELVMEPCLCRAEQKRQCQPYTRLTVVLPEFPFIGTWRLETKGWNAAEELPGMFEMLQACAQKGIMLDAVLSVERRERVTPTGKRRYVVPRIATRNTVLELAAGGGALQPALGAPAPLELASPPVLFASVDDEIADAEVVEPERLEVEALLRGDAENFGLNPTAFVNAIVASTDGDLELMRKASASVRAGLFEPLTIVGGVVKWKKVTTDE